MENKKFLSFGMESSVLDEARLCEEQLLKVGQRIAWRFKTEKNSYLIESKIKEINTQHKFLSLDDHWYLINELEIYILSEKTAPCIDYYED